MPGPSRTLTAPGFGHTLETYPATVEAGPGALKMTHTHRKLAPIPGILCLWAYCIPVFAQQDTEAAATQVQTLRAEAVRYEQEIDRLDGSYDQSSAEVLRALAGVYWELGELDQAAQTYQEALQSLRIHEGLASEAQLEVISEANGLLFELEAWEELDTNFHLVADISRRLFGVSDARYIRAANSLAGWKVRAYQTGIYQGRGNRSIQLAADIYRSLAEQLSESEPDYARRLANYHSAQGLAHFYSARFAASLPLEEFRAAPQNSNLQSCIPVILSVDSGAQASSAACQVNQSSDAEYFAAQQREKNNLVRRNLSNMRQSFLLAIEALEQSPDATLREKAIALLNYGDANMLAEDFQRARTQYARAYEMLSQTPETIEIRAELMDKPTKALHGIIGELPFDRILRENPALGTISFDVGERGEILNINIEGAENALVQENLGAIAMMLEQSPYRPRIVDGRPVRSRISLSTAQL